MGAFEQPRDYFDAEYRSAILESEITRIEEQLADPARKPGNLDDVDEAERFLGWKRKAEDAIHHKQSELHFLRAFMAREKEGMARLKVALSEAVPIIVGINDRGAFPELENLVAEYGLFTGTASYA